MLTPEQLKKRQDNLNEQLESLEEICEEVMDQCDAVEEHCKNYCDATDKSVTFDLPSVTNFLSKLNALNMCYLMDEDNKASVSVNSIISLFTGCLKVLRGNLSYENKQELVRNEFLPHFESLIISINEARCQRQRNLLVEFDNITNPAYVPDSKKILQELDDIKAQLNNMSEAMAKQNKSNSEPNKKPATGVLSLFSRN